MPGDDFVFRVNGKKKNVNLEDIIELVDGTTVKYNLKSYLSSLIGGDYYMAIAVKELPVDNIEGLVYIPEKAEEVESGNVSGNGTGSGETTGGSSGTGEQPGQ